MSRGCRGTLLPVPESFAVLLEIGAKLAVPPCYFDDGAPPTPSRSGETSDSPNKGGDSPVLPGRDREILKSTAAMLRLKGRSAARVDTHQGPAATRNNKL